MTAISRVPRFVTPQVPILSTEPSEGGGWIHETKHDNREGFSFVGVVTDPEDGQV